ncbi:hypothetical protein J6590_035718 [Homalodisca vitripennis]|nr:hypothetical protein J6590_035718 [Homalodisca vitripennis]
MKDVVKQKTPDTTKLTVQKNRHVLPRNCYLIAEEQSNDMQGRNIEITVTSPTVGRPSASWQLINTSIGHERDKWRAMPYMGGWAERAGLDRIWGSWMDRLHNLNWTDGPTFI